MRLDRVLDAAAIDVPPSTDVPPSIDVPTELTDDIPPGDGLGRRRSRSGGRWRPTCPVAADVGVDTPVVPTDTGWGPTGYRVVRNDPAMAAGSTRARSRATRRC
jgi:hypothetical protein